MKSAGNWIKSAGFGLGALAVGAVFAVTPAPAQAQGTLTVLCGVQEEWCKAIAVAFEKKSGIAVAMSRKSAGEALAQIRAESANPKTDVWWGGPGDPHLQAAEEGLTLAYESPQYKDLQPWAQSQYKQSQGRSIGIYAGALGFTYNTELLGKRKIQAPKCWADLLRPEFKDEIQVANPNASGTAYTALATLVQIFGEDKAFDYLKKLNDNVNQYTKSGSAPAAAVARSETLVGIIFMHDGINQKINGFPVDVSAPCEGTGYEIGSVSIIKGSKNLDAAKAFYEFSLSPEGQATGAETKQYQMPSNRKSAVPPEAPNLEEIRLIDYNFQKYGTAEERKRLLSRWDAEIKSVAR
ncbi:ABC transporter substrate-binding protein [Azospirillum endophyticum]